MMVIALLVLCSCAQIGSYAEKLKMQELNEECQKSIKDYNNLLRWREIEKAGMLFVDRTLLDDYIQKAEKIKKREVTITDFRILTTECLAEKKSAAAVVEFDYYTLPSNRISTLTYRQNWKYVDTEEKKGWLIKTGLPEFE
jgi:hypothetical protein